MGEESRLAKELKPDLEGLRVPFGMRDGRLYAPVEVDRGLACQCSCPACGSRLIANKPKIKRNYFSHHRGEDCPGGYETAVHLMAKQIIVDAGRVVIPPHGVVLTVPLIAGESLKETVEFPARNVVFSSVVSEQSAGRWRPDLTATLKNAATLYIEILVTHAVEEPKARELDNLMEIDLSRLPPEVVSDPEQLAEAVLEGALRYWHRCSLYNDVRPVGDARARLEGQKEAAIRRAAEQKKLEQDRETAHLSFERHKAEKHAQYQVQIEQLMRMKLQENVRVREAALAESSHFALEAVRDRLSSECLPGHYLPETVGFKIHGDWIFNADRRVWQAFVFEKFIWRRPKGEKIRASSVVNAIVREIGVWGWMQELAALKRENKQKGKQRGAWYAEKGVWFLTDAENRAIVSPYFVVLKYLEQLCLHPYCYLEMLNLGSEFGVVWNSVPLRAEHREEEKRKADLRMRNLVAKFEAEIEAEEIRALEAEKASQKNWLPEDKRYERNVERMAELAAGGALKAQLCSFCHCPTADLQATVCPECEAGDVQPVELTHGYVNSFPHRLRSMPRIRSKK